MLGRDGRLGSLSDKDASSVGKRSTSNSAI